jgi:hypothetical protein
MTTSILAPFTAPANFHEFVDRYATYLPSYVRGHILTPAPLAGTR